MRRLVRCLSSVALLALALAAPVRAQSLELPYEQGFEVTELGHSLVIPTDLPHFDPGLGTVTGVSVRVDVDRICGNTMYTNHTGSTASVDVLRSLQIAVSDLVAGTPLTSRQPVGTGSIPMEVPAGQTVKFSECGGSPVTLLFPNIPLGAALQAAATGGLGLDVEITPAAPPQGVTLDRIATYLEGKVTLVWHFQTSLGNGAAAWSASSGWTNLGQGLPGTGGRIPSFMGTGTLADGAFVGLVLWDIAPATPVYLVVGASAQNLPFKGGVMVPFPNARVPLTSNDEGAVVLTKQLTGHVAGGGQLFLQFWVEDAGAVEGYSGSNAIRVDAP